MLTAAAAPAGKLVATAHDAFLRKKRNQTPRTHRTGGRKRKHPFYTAPAPPCPAAVCTQHHPHTRVMLN